MTDDGDAPSIFDDLKKLKADSAIPMDSDGKPIRSGWTRHGTFTPREWGVALKKASRVGTFLLTDELLYRHWRAGQGKYGHRDGPVVISRDFVEAAGISARSARNALAQLEQLGLVSVIRTNHSSPRAFPLRIPSSFWRK